MVGQKMGLFRNMTDARRRGVEDVGARANWYESLNGKRADSVAGERVMEQRCVVNM